LVFSVWCLAIGLMVLIDRVFLAGNLAGPKTSGRRSDWGRFPQAFGTTYLLFQAQLVFFERLGATNI
jgi:hypothetical protein